MHGSTSLDIAGLTFEIACAGEPNAPLVLLLHGFPQTHYSFRHALPALAAAGFHAVAPNQRGYSPGARPLAIHDYTTDRLIDDALAIAAAHGSERFHLVGHDWGGQLAWLIAARHPERVRTLCVLSRPHPAAFAGAIQRDQAQRERSRHHRAFHDPDMAERLLADGARRLRRMLGDQGVSSADSDVYLAQLGAAPALDAALHWYRAASHADSQRVSREVPSVSAPTLYVWGDADATVGRAAAEATAQHVAGPFRFEVVRGAGHFLTDQAGEQVAQCLLEHLRRHRDA